MKKTAIILSLALFGLATMPSCKKKYSCNCTINGVTNSTNYDGQSKKDAEAACNAQNIAAKILGGSCSLD